MSKPLTAEDIIPLVACLTPRERARLLRLIGARSVSDATAYEALPPARDELSVEGEDPLGWDAEGWEDVG